ncbi:extracellular solute-binding protein [Paenibacillus sp. SYP-B3998]|uniref:Extracellular solute-binding protein n=1 Tax=Paenibacillus sp. SYP-B3998 TaxID=2678564 RepID=A0A6G4A4X0_9BACL|nr:extracellular solute-binding protein [Paenibacillus sp. SYP-B3998]NEW09513.1 extracellular solute-binding protein [Paenibacillus sp. SYP-B3998]
MKKLSMSVISGIMAVSIISGCASTAKPGTSPASAAGSPDAAPSSAKVKLQFFQNKTEAKNSFDSLIKKFQAANPNIEVTQVNPPDAETVLKVNISKSEVPDIIGIGATDTFTSLSKGGTFIDFSNNENIKNIQPAYLDMVKKQGGTSELNGIPFSSNADGIIYNKTLFAELGLTIPKTWDELVATAQKIKDAGKVPFYNTFKDSWTTMPAFNAFSSNLQSDTFFEDRKANKVKFADAYKEIAEKQLKLVEFGHKDQNGKGYADGNTAFAKGASVMYLQGVWAIPEIVKANPDIKLGTFPYPVSNDASKNKVVSGVDTLLTISKTSKHQAEANKFIDFLLQPDNVKQFITEQKAFSAIKGISQDDPSVADLNAAFQSGQLVDFADHSIPGAMKADTIVQEFVFKKNVGEFLNKLDTEWDKVQARK